MLALVPPGFDTPCPLSANTTYVGPITDPNPRPPLDPRDAGLLAAPGRPWVLLSLSTTVQGQAAALPRILGAGAPPADIAATVRDLLADPAALREYRRFAGIIAGLGGGNAAAQAVIRLAGARALDRALFTA